MYVNAVRRLTKAGLRAADTRATYTAADDEKAVAVLASLYSKEQPSRDLAAKAACESSVAFSLHYFPMMGFHLIAAPTLQNVW